MRWPRISDGRYRHLVTGIDEDGRLYRDRAVVCGLYNLGVNLAIAGALAAAFDKGYRAARYKDLFDEVCW
jgi:hypothetical protein